VGVRVIVDVNVGVLVLVGVLAGKYVGVGGGRIVLQDWRTPEIPNIKNRVANQPLYFLEDVVLQLWKQLPLIKRFSCRCR